MENYHPEKLTTVEQQEKEKRDVVFIDPPIHTDQQLAYSLLDDSLQGQEIPKGAHSIASFLESKKISTAVIPMDSFLKKQKFESEDEFNHAMEKFIDDVVAKQDPKILAFSLMYTFAEQSVLVMTKYAKDHYPNKPVVVGGNYATFSSKFLLDAENKTGVDVVVRGEGEWTMEELAKELMEEKPDLSKIKGIAYRNKSGEVIENPPRQRGDLYELPPLDYSLVKKPKDIDISNFNHNIMFARACKGNCAFCTSPKMWERKISRSTMDNFKAELDFLIRNGVKTVGVLDDDILMEKESFEKIISELIRVYKNNPDVKFIAQTRVDRLRNAMPDTSEILEKMKEAGIVRLYLGIESGSPQILKEMKKGYKVEWVKEACMNVKKAGIEVGGFWLFGHPGATKEEEEKSLAFLEELLKEKLIDDLEPHIIIPLAGTSLENDPRIQIFDHDKKHYGFLNNQPVYNLINPETGETVLSSQEIRSFLERALALRKKYLGVDVEAPTRPIESDKSV